MKRDYASGLPAAEFLTRQLTRLSPTAILLVTAGIDEMHGLRSTQARTVSMGMLAMLLASAVYAQQPSPAATPVPTIPYVDKALGFELQVPAGWNYDRTGFFGPGASLGLLRGASPDGRATLQILVFREPELRNFPDWMQFFAKQLASIDGTEQVRVKGDPAAGRAAAYVVVEARLGVDRTRTLYYCVQFDADTIWVFSYATALGRTLVDQAQDTPESDREVNIPAEFTRLTGTLRVFYDPQLAQQIAVALQRGKDYLARYQLQADMRDLHIDGSVRYYEIREGGKPIGYLTRQFTREREPLQHPSRTARAKEGLRVRERSYRFADDGTVYFSKIDLFSSRDAETDLYELWQARIAPPDAPVREPLIMQDQCVREGDTLFSTYTTSQEQGFPAPRRPLKLDATYLGLAWARLLPALLGPQPRPALAFTVYDPETRTLITHTITPLGEKALPGEPARKACAFETREGFVEQPAIVYADDHGNMLRLEAGEFVLTASDKEMIDKKFGQRRDAADARLEERR
jgi:hypothetical protein